MAAKRKSYTVAFKRKVINEIVKGDLEKGILATSRRYMLNERMVRRWFKRKDDLDKCAKERVGSIKKIRKLGGGRKVKKA